MVAVFFDQRGCLLVVACQQHFAAAAHTQRRLVAVQGLGAVLLALYQQELEQVRQDGTVETYGVLYQQDGLNADLEDVVLGVHLVLNQLDDG